MNLRLNGYSLYTLALMFNCDRSSLYHQFKKYEIEPYSQIVSFERIIAENLPKPPPFESRWETINGVRYNLGRKYKDYLEIATRKPISP